MVIIRMEVDYVNQLYYGQDVTVYTGIERIGNTSLTIYEEIHQNGGCARKAGRCMSISILTPGGLNRFRMTFGRNCANMYGSQASRRKEVSV